MTPQVEIQLIAAVAAAACALPGVFLVLRRMALLSDAISHTVLLGIAIGFVLTGNIASPVLVIGAAIVGVLTVTLVELLVRTDLVKKDAAIGIVFPALFSIGVIIISRYADKVHLDTDAVLLGELAFAPFDRMIIMGRDAGPKALFVMSAILAANALFIGVFYKELKIATFDAALAATLGFSPGILHYALMTLVSITAVGAFDAVGSILVVALVIAPPAAAYMLTDRLSRMIFLSILIGISGAVAGYWLARAINANIGGSIATTLGMIFLAIFMLAPGRGLVAQARRHVRQRTEFASKMLAIHLLNHEGLPEAERESMVKHLNEHFRWTPQFAANVVRHSERRGLIQKANARLILTDAGRNYAQEAVVS